MFMRCEHIAANITLENQPRFAMELIRYDNRRWFQCIRMHTVSMIGMHDVELGLNETC